jgi:HlyD family secretion protein
VHQQELATTGPSGGSGIVEGTEIALSTRIMARVIELPVRDRQQVEKGDLVVRLDCAEPTAALAEGEAKLEMARSQALAAQAGARAAGRNAEAAESAAKAAGAQLAVVAAQRDAVERQAGRLGELEQDVSAANLDEARSQAEGLSHQYEAVSNSGKAAAAQANAAREQAAAARAQAAAAEDGVEAGLAGLERARLMIAECAILAPRAATVESVFVEVGELASPAQALARLIDLSELTASFYLPNAELAAAKSGAPAEVRADAWPSDVFGGTVRTVAAEAEFTPRNIQTRTDRDRLVYRIEIDLPNPEGKLRPGMPVQVILPGTAP